MLLIELPPFRFVQYMIGYGGIRLLLLCIIAHALKHMPVRGSKLGVLYNQASLGNQMQLGGLYDAKHEKAMLGLSLWDRAFIEENKIVSNSEHISAAAMIERNFKDRKDMMGLAGHMELSFLSDLVSVDGSAKYLLADKKTDRLLGSHIMGPVR